MLIQYFATKNLHLENSFRYNDWVFLSSGIIYTVYGIGFAIPGIASIKIFKKYVNPFY